ncbi:MAG: TonB-dependent receptor [Alphaproteobacteria bacterium]|nr:TonB-dependent receptor [Alphaproteobacteria bacterium]
MRLRSTYLVLPLACAAAGALAQETTERQPLEITVTRPNLEEGIPAGIAADTIDAGAIARSPAQSLPALMAQEPGVQFRDLFGGYGGARAYIDLRGFGAVATQNTLTLLNGRRLNDIDNAGVEFINIPPGSIRRIEILRGNSAAVLYGDGAVGGSVNIITRPGGGTSGNAAQGAIGAFGLREGRAFAARSSRDWSIAADGNTLFSDGWRENNKLEQRGVNLELRRFGAAREWYGTFAADAQHLGLPGARRVELKGDDLEVWLNPRGATTPNDFVDQTGIRTVVGTSRLLAGGGELVLDGGVRIKQQDSIVKSPFGPDFDTTTNSRLATYSFTPRIRWEPDGRVPRGIVGLDYYYSDYNQLNHGEDPHILVHRYDLKQHSLAVYGQGDRPLGRATDLSAGLRLQHIRFIGGDILNPQATITFGGDPFDGHRESARFNDDQWAGHLGVEHTLTGGVVLFGRLGRAFRLPTVDERVLSSARYDSFALHTQTSWDAEVGSRWRVGTINLRASLYQMDLKNEMHFNAETFLNENLAPTRRRGMEAGAEVALSRTLGVDLGVAYTRATFREGPNGGNDLPLVSKWTGAAALWWEFRPEWTLTTTVTGFGWRRMENDDDAAGPRIPGEGLLDLKVSSRQGAWMVAAQVNNLFDASYFNYAVRSSSTPTTYNAYPLPGRSWRVEAGLRF